MNRNKNCAERTKNTIKKTIAVIAVLMAMLLLTACGKKTYTVQDFAGKWKLYGLSTYGEENLANFGEAVRKHLGGGISINGERICLLYDLEYEMLYGDICTFEVKENKLLFHDLGVEDVPDFGEFEADFKMEGNKLILTQGNTTLELEKQ